MIGIYSYRIIDLPQNNAINLRPFLDPSDGGTGFQLRDDSGTPAFTPTPVPTKPSSLWILNLNRK
ncbi:hypothetical protein [cyanobacterium endosymbiont of Epithemia turgida]|uniref:hypothetical protein n=1 Tax=cyanobacterium endosymbiont of Epithemia turgida TaxID=718217 RepID=UPI0004D1646A|nr:hypothetical protein [cyanobacterium endosymbiont of Epithemia turgida]BAP18479.1 hypothetical protein ETSB_1775 [cyanobacterium endosymbiont of Epithemia turgida isolate EtSB Lake Yunoko]